MPRLAEDLTGKKFGRLTVLERYGSRKSGVLWRCRCDCGGEKITASTSLTRLLTRSCGCLRAETLSSKLHDHTGKRFGRLLVIRREQDRYVRAAWFCRCDCGVERIFTAQDLVSGRTVSCGCFRRDRTSLPPGEGAFNRFLLQYTSGAKKNGREFSLTREEFRHLTQQECWYCGASPKPQSYRHRTGPYSGNGIDRVDNSRGYVSDNVRPCCLTCNHAKKTMAEVDFIAWLRRIAEKWCKCCGS